MRSLNSSPPVAAAGACSAASADADGGSFFFLAAGTFGTNLPCSARRAQPSAVDSEVPRRLAPWALHAC